MWSVELNVECPACTKYVDLLETAGFMCDAPFEIAEHGTEKTRDVEVSCPKCGFEFYVDLEY